MIRIKKTIKKKTAKKLCPYLSSGSTLLNLACTNNPFGCFMGGKYYYLVGDSTSGKTFLSMTCFAESINHSKFQNYRLIYDNVEDGMLFNVEKLFGKKVNEKLEAPNYDENNEPIYSSTIEEFYYNVDDAVIKAKEDGKPFIYVLDSMDGLNSESAEEKFDAQKKAYRVGKDSPGSYGDGKAKKNSEGIRKVLNGLQKTDSILIIISQTRDNLAFGPSKKTRSGGHALKFYATIEMWSSIMGRLKKTVKKKDRNIGVKVKIELKKNRITGQLHTVETMIYPSYGIDDIGSCIDYLLSEKYWAVKKQTIIATEFEIECTRDKLISHIEENNLYKELQRITGRCWRDIQEQSELKRPSRYGEE